MRNSIRAAALFSIGLLLVGLFFWYQGPSAKFPHLSQVELGGHVVGVTIANTPETRARGLSGRMALAPDEGMLFMFPEDGRYGFWMKDMLFSIDILWLSDEGRIVSMVQNLSPETYPKTFEPEQAARSVLELRAGWVKEHGVQLGDIIRF